MTTVLKIIQYPHQSRSSSYTIEYLSKHTQISNFTAVLLGLPNIKWPLHTPELAFNYFFPGNHKSTLLARDLYASTNPEVAMAGLAEVTQILWGHRSWLLGYCGGTNFYWDNNTSIVVELRSNTAHNKSKLFLTEKPYKSIKLSFEHIFWQKI